MRIAARRHWNVVDSTRPPRARARFRFTLRYFATLGAFDPRPIEEHLRDEELLSFREHPLTAQETPHLLCVVCTRQASLTPS